MSRLPAPCRPRVRPRAAPRRRSLARPAAAQRAAAVRPAGLRQDLDARAGRARRRQRGLDQLLLRRQGRAVPGGVLRADGLAAGRHRALQRRRAEPGAGAGRAVRRLPRAAEAGRHGAAVHEAALPRDARTHRPVGGGDRPRHQADARRAAGRAVPPLRRGRARRRAAAPGGVHLPAWACTCMSATTSSDAAGPAARTTAPMRSTAGPTGW